MIPTSRQEALAVGAVRYFTGEPCRNGHISERYTKGMQCAECTKGTRDAWRAIHADRERESNRARYTANRVAIRAKAAAEYNPERAAAYYVANKAHLAAEKARKYRENPAKHIEAVAAWRRAHPQGHAANESRRRARRVGALGNGVSGAEWKEVLEGALGICVYCNERKPLTLDHIEPLSRGGAHDVENAAPCCLSCNSSKYNTPLLLWLVGRSR